MKLFTIACSIILFTAVTQANADCINNPYGKRLCGKGPCEMDQYGKVFCAQPGGGAINDNDDNVRCGVGNCLKDDLGRVRCSKVQGGDASMDENGRVTCQGGCENGKMSLCEEAK